LRILTFTTLYPSVARPTHGIFVETRLRKLVEGGGVSARVVAPCPWFPITSSKFGAYSVFARTPRTETRHGIEIDHPRYPLLPKIGMSWAPLAICAAVLPQLRRQMREGKEFDLIDAHYFYPDGVAAILLGRALNRPVVITARGSDLNLIATYGLPQRWMRWAAGHAAGLVTVSAGLKRRLVALGASPDCVRVLRNGVDLAAFRPPPDREAARRSLGFTNPTLLAVGNLIPLKRHALIIEALAHLQGIDLAIVGDGPERPRIEAMVRQLGLAGRVRLLGRLPQESLPCIYGAADLLVHPSLREGWPNVLLESMACGTPVLAADFDSVGEIIGAPEAGGILARATPIGLAEAIGERLAARPQREAIRRYAEGFDWQVTTAGQLELFRQICNHTGTAPTAANASIEQAARNPGTRFARSGPDRKAFPRARSGQMGSSDP
jgi:teichuronic acid biosynthesis glycosyltransferase TuaC